MRFKIGFDFIDKKIIKNEPNEIVSDERYFLEKIIPHLDCNSKDLHIVANSDDYTTLQYKQIDIVRVKYTDKTKWIKIRMSNQDMKDEINNPLFVLQNKKTESMWKCNINDIDKLYSYLNHFIKQFDELNK